MDVIWMAMSTCQVPLFTRRLQYVRSPNRCNITAALVEAMFHSRFPAKARVGPKAGIKCQIFASVRRGRRLAPLGIGCRRGDRRLRDPALPIGNARVAISA